MHLLYGVWDKVVIVRVWCIIPVMWLEKIINCAVGQWITSPTLLWALTHSSSHTSVTGIRMWNTKFSNARVTQISYHHSSHTWWITDFSSSFLSAFLWQTFSKSSNWSWAGLFLNFSLSGEYCASGSKRGVTHLTVIQRLPTSVLTDVVERTSLHDHFLLFFHS